jgi:hypothetical protein
MITFFNLINFKIFSLTNKFFNIIENEYNIKDYVLKVF